MNWMQALAGGVLIGVSAVVLLAGSGRIAGISGIFNQAITFRGAAVWTWFFLAGLMGGGLIYEKLLAATPTPTYPLAPVVMLAGGLLAGFGARMGGGCTSGHGVCGLGRFSLRSLVAVLTFMATAIVTVWVMRHSGWMPS